MPTEPNFSAADLRLQLADALQTKGTIKSAAVYAAFRDVPRHVFVPHADLETAYADGVIPVKYDENKQAISSSSQPTMMAIMLEQLDLQPGMRVLEIGAGTGYNAALMGHIVGDAGLVTTLDIDADLIEGAQQHLHAAGMTNVYPIQRDGALGAGEYAPYDRIILTVAAWDVTPAWLAQLKPHGRIVMPLILATGTQVSAAFDRHGAGLRSDGVSGCRFMTLRGLAAAPHQPIYVDLASGLSIQHPSTLTVDPQQVTHYLKTPPQVISSGVELTHSEINPFLLWASVRGMAGVTLITRGDLIGKDVIPVLYGKGDQYQATSGIMHPDGMALWGWRASAEPNQPHVYELVAHAYGDDGPAAARELLACLHAWDAAGRPGTRAMHIQVLPKHILLPDTTHQLVLEKPSVNLIVRFAE